MKRKYSRREFVKQNSMIGLGAVMPFGINSSFLESLPKSENYASYIDRIDNEIILHGRRNNQAWFEPSVGVIPGKGIKPPQVFVKATLLTGNDIGPQLYIKTDNLGKTWTNPILCQNWFKVPLDNHVWEEPWFGFIYHNRTDQFFAIGDTHFVQDAGTVTGQKNERHYNSPELRRSIVYSLWNPLKEDFEPWVRMKLPGDLYLSIYSHGQFHVEDDGTILIPGYYRGTMDEPVIPIERGVTVLRCKFDGRKLQYIEHGSVHVVREVRGLAEPSVIHLNGKYFLTVRHDLRGYVTSGDNGLQYDELIPWCFDDGEELGNYNTQQKWLKHKDTLYLVYNRRSELNRGVFRSRAPLFMAEVDPERLVVLRDTERIVFPEKGARSGNFNIANVAENEAWVFSGEWLQGMFPHSKKGDRFWVDSSNINYIQYIGNLNLGRIYWRKT